MENFCFSNVTIERIKRQTKDPRKYLYIIYLTNNNIIIITVRET